VAPTVSFIVPLFNGLPLTQTMVQSLRATIPRGLAHEIVLVDDGSTDGTGAWLDGLGEPFRVVRNGANEGYARSNNRGAEAAQGSLLVLLNNDLVLRPRWLEPMLEAREQLGPRAGLIGNVQRNLRTGRVDHFGISITHQGKPAHRRGWGYWWDRLWGPVRPVPAVTGACVLVEHELWNHLGGFDERFINGCEDVDLCFRATEAGRINAVALRSVVRHHISATPGRKAHDEANTRLLTLRWRETLVRLGRRDWCRHHIATFLPEPRDFPDPAFARAVALYFLGLRRLPAGADAGMRAAIAVELDRWNDLLGPVPEAGRPRLN
jgi:GT2 family glycosyltransferase